MQKEYIYFLQYFHEKKRHFFTLHPCLHQPTKMTFPIIFPSLFYKQKQTLSALSSDFLSLSTGLVFFGLLAALNTASTSVEKSSPPSHSSSDGFNFDFCT